MDEESYVIRIYRKEAQPAHHTGGRRNHDRVALTGLVEAVERGERRSFHDIEELWAILTGSTRKQRDETG